MTETSSHKHLCQERCAFRRVYLTRYALTHEKNPAFDAITTLGKEGGLVTDIKSSGPMWNFFYTLRLLRPGGRIYVYEESVQMLKAYTVSNALGNGQKPFFVEVHEDEPYIYVAYSEVDWPKDYWDNMLADGAYQRRMQRIDLVNAGAKHTAPLEQYTELVEEYRERPGKLLSLRHLMEDSVFEPVSLEYDERLKASSKELVIGERWQSSANPFGDYKKEFFAQKKMQKDYVSLPHPWRPDTSASPAPVLAALADPLGEGLDLATIHSNNLEDVMLYTGYYGYTYILGKIFVNLDKETLRPVENPDGSELSPENPLYLSCSLVEQAIPEKPWIPFLQAQDAMRSQFRKLLREYITCWRQWLLAQDTMHSFFWALQDFQHENADSKILSTGRQAFVFCHGHMDHMLPDVESIHALFYDQTWVSFFKHFLNPKTPCDESANMLISLLAKESQTSSIMAHRDLIEYATEFIRQQDNIRVYQGTSKDIGEFMNHTLVFQDMDAAQEEDADKNSQTPDNILQTQAPFQKSLQWDVPGLVASAYAHNPPTIANISVFDVANHVKITYLCNAISTLNYLNMVLGSVISFSSGLTTFVKGLKEKDDLKIGSGAITGIAAIADFAAFRIIQNGSLPYFAQLPAPHNAYKISVASWPKTPSARGMEAASRVLIVNIAKPLLIVSWVMTSLGDCMEIIRDWREDRKDAAILGGSGIFLGGVAVFANSFYVWLLAVLTALGAFSLRRSINNDSAIKKLLQESYWFINKNGVITSFSFRNFLSYKHNYYAPFENFPEKINIARFSHVAKIYQDIQPVSIGLHFQDGHPELSLSEAVSSEFPYKRFNGLNNYTRVEITLSKLFVSLDQTRICIKEKWNDEETYYEHALSKPYPYSPTVSDRNDSVTCEFMMDDISLMRENLCSNPRNNSGKYMSFIIQITYRNAITNQMETYEKIYHFIRPDFITPDYMGKIKNVSSH